MRKFISLFLAAVLLSAVICSAPFAVSAAADNSVTVGVQRGTTGRCTWTLDDEGTLTISGNGNMGNYDNYQKTPWYRYYRDSIKRVIIENGVTTISSYSFYYCTNLASIIIPDSVTSIGHDAFYNTAWYNNQPDGLVYAGNVAYKYKGTMPNNSSIAIRSGTKSITDYAFSNCNGLKSVTIPDSVTSIGERAFYYCTNLASIIIPDSVTSIGERAFYECSCLTSIDIPDSVTSIGDYAFCECSRLTSATIGNSVTSIGICMFKNCSVLTSVTIGNSVTSIGDYAFYLCPVLTSVNIPDSVTSIGENAFNGCSGLTNVTIGNSVKSIGDGAFCDCTGLASVNIPNGVKSIGFQTFYNCKGLTSIIIPDSVTSIGNQAFYCCLSLTSVTVGSNVTSIGNQAFGYESQQKKVDGFTIYGYKGGEAERYANDNGFNFFEIGGTPIEPTTEPVTEPATEPVTEPATEPATEPVTEPATEPVTEPATEPTSEPVTEPKPDGIIDGVYYENGVAKNPGLVRIGNDFYCTTSGGKIVYGDKIIYSSRTNGLLPAGTYHFDEVTGKLYKDNVIIDDVYYKEGAPKNVGIVKVAGSYYVTTTKGVIVKDVENKYIASSRTNGLIAIGYYDFGADGKMILKNGIIGGKYYVNGKASNVGLFEYEVNGVTNIYCTTTGGVLVKNITDKYIAKSRVNGLVPAGYYSFDADGKMITG